LQTKNQNTGIMKRILPMFIIVLMMAGCTTTTAKGVTLGGKVNHPLSLTIIGTTNGGRSVVAKGLMAL